MKRCHTGAGTCYEMNISNNSLNLEKLFARNIELNDETEIILYQSEIGDVGCVVWDAALVLCKYLETGDFDGGKVLKGKTVLELGSGTGAVGLVAAALGADSILTDLPQFVPLMQHNISANESVLKGSCSATALTWGTAKDIETVKQKTPMGSDGFDYVLVADCVYYEQSIEPLVETIKSVSCATTTVLCCYEDRDIGNKTVLQNKFFKMAEEYFQVVEIPESCQDAQFRSPDIHIMQLTRKQQQEQQGRTPS